MAEMMGDKEAAGDKKARVLGQAASAAAKKEEIKCWRKQCGGPLPTEHPGVYTQTEDVLRDALRDGLDPESRGYVLDSPLGYFRKGTLEQLEPFTKYDKKQLSELYYDPKKSKLKLRDIMRPEADIRAMAIFLLSKNNIDILETIKDPHYYTGYSWTGNPAWVANHTKYATHLFNDDDTSRFVLKGEEPYVFLEPKGVSAKRMVGRSFDVEKSVINLAEGRSGLIFNQEEPQELAPEKRKIRLGVNLNIYSNGGVFDFSPLKNKGQFQSVNISGSPRIILSDTISWYDKKECTMKFIGDSSRPIEIVIPPDLGLSCRSIGNEDIVEDRKPFLKLGFANADGGATTLSIPFLKKDRDGNGTINSVNLVVPMPDGKDFVIPVVKEGEIQLVDGRPVAEDPLPMYNEVLGKKLREAQEELKKRSAGLERKRVTEQKWKRGGLKLQ